MNIRCAKTEDLMNMQHCNLLCLPENYQMKYYFYHGLVVAAALVRRRGRKRQDRRLRPGQNGRGLRRRSPRPHHVPGREAIPPTTRARPKAHGPVVASHGRVLQRQVRLSFTSEKSNRAALHLYTNTLGFTINEIEPKYYADGEDAYAMKRDLVGFATQNKLSPTDPVSFFDSKAGKRDKEVDSEKH
uniref:N-acetyltransferase domain-containing protein n=1 Tax=Ixodes ricinus TaxID=34613 RepID=A0A090XDQ8_IXORI